MYTIDRSRTRLPALGIFAKTPRPGQVKTRFCPPLTPEEAAHLYQASLFETLERMGQGSFAPTLFHAGAPDWFAAHCPGLPRLPQGEGNLGRRLERGLTHLLEQGAPAAALIGSDSPDLPVEQVEAAFALLETAEVVTIPAIDGGYVLIGARRPYPELFRDMPWSTPELLAATRYRAQTLGLDYRELSPWEDLDDLAALRRLIDRSPHSATARHALAHLPRHIRPPGTCNPPARGGITGIDPRQGRTS
ncbi:MAG: TIGR04282 family arsenosugar biosynthesis glycosyltransferase [Trichloromonas sp.]|nr:TIGR04282 family arsenosugar biosynthesis glycosyltransferase [Trichloromonas sp.]